MSVPINGETYKALRKPSRYIKRANRNARKYGFASAAHMSAVQSAIMQGIARGRAANA